MQSVSVGWFDKKMYVKRYMQPFHIDPTADSDDPRDEVLRLVEEGKEAEVIHRFDPEARLPADPRLLLPLVGAHIQHGTLGRALELAEHAIEYYKSVGDIRREATALAQRGRLAWRLELDRGFQSALVYFERALLLDPLCATAIACRLCYVSVERDPELLMKFVDDFLRRIPDFLQDPFYVRFLSNDAQLAWAREQPCFAKLCCLAEVLQ